MLYKIELNYETGIDGFWIQVYNYSCILFEVIFMRRELDVCYVVMNYAETIGYWAEINLQTIFINFIYQI